MGNISPQTTRRRIEYHRRLRKEKEQRTERVPSRLMYAMDRLHSPSKAPDPEEVRKIRFDCQGCDGQLVPTVGIDFDTGLGYAITKLTCDQCDSVVDWFEINTLEMLALAKL